MNRAESTFVQKACAYLTRPTGELLVFESPEHDGLQIPKGTVESGETPREAVFREVAEESGLGAFGEVRQLASDVWLRRDSRWYVRHFFHSVVHDAPDSWTHTITDGGGEDGLEFEFSWVDPATAGAFALDLDEYVDLLYPHPA
ncbi:NUDIX hydrolase [Halorarius litoreus]|uniref:NUDIX hydrolase n=1 Tax=Halorarius litoreus TaxID=2962676 RepID=UPI0020CB806C|nr:NUDIX domain-containing protein [Halorarius litoreus]